MDEDQQGMNKPIVNRPLRRRAQKRNVLGIITTVAGLAFLSWAYKQWRLGVSAAPQSSRPQPEPVQTHTVDSSSKAGPLLPPMPELGRSLTDFLGTAFASYVSVGVAAGLLIVAELFLRKDMAKVASQALAGLSSVPLMAVSVALISASSLLLIAITAALPLTCAKGAAFLNKSFKEVVTFSTQLPFAIAGVALAAAVKRTVTFGDAAPLYYHLWLVGICAGIAMLERILAHLVDRICRAPKEVNQRIGTVAIALIAFGLLLIAAIKVIDWGHVTEQEKICPKIDARA
ncbi:hypothetical protein [Stenotrophomonas sp. 59]|uniref:hypothetical protein n=1 Tax=Stenotrophomonas sp. 59 TaxID=3051120 RepID=UPI00256F1E56|nr:hypothetical protein [Stenotrophomonas sp. 59]